MSFSRDDAVEAILFFQRAYLPHQPGVVAAWMTLIDSGWAQGRTLQASMTAVAGEMIREVARQHDVLPAATGSALAQDVANSLAPATVLSLFYPHAWAADRDVLLKAMTDGSVRNTDFLIGWLDEADDERFPSGYEILESVFEAGLGQARVRVPTLDLKMPGLTDKQTEFLVGVYVAAFDRAPDHGGLTYWSGELAQRLKSGMNEADAFKQVAAVIHGTGSARERGDFESHADYVDYIYDTVLDRDPDPAGLAHWTQALASGMSRSDLIVSFVTSGMRGTGDGELIKARILVAEYAAQAHVSGTGRTIDLAEFLDDVDDLDDALREIGELARLYPAGSGQVAWFAATSSLSDVQFARVASSGEAAYARSVADDVVAPLTLAGVAAGLDEDML